MFSIVVKPNNYVFGDEIIPHIPRGMGCKLQTDHCLHLVMVIGNCTNVFTWTFLRCVGGGARGEGVSWEDLSMEGFIIREENFHDFLALFNQKKRENKFLKSFFQMEVRSSIKTSNEEKLLRI